MTGVSLPAAIRDGRISSVYLVVVNDLVGRLFHVRAHPDPEIWLRPGATAADVARTYLAALESPAPISSEDPAAFDLEHYRKAFEAACADGRLLAEKCDSVTALLRDAVELVQHSRGYEEDGIGAAWLTKAQAALALEKEPAC